MSLLAPSARGGMTMHHHTQPVASTSWVINHNRGRRPRSVLCYNEDGEEIDGTVTNPTLNQTVVLHQNPSTGEAHLIL